MPDAVHEAADFRLRIPLREGLRSLNIAVAVAMVRQMAADYAREKIRFNALCPGFVDTPFNAGFERQMGGRSALESYIRQLAVELGRRGQSATVQRRLEFPPDHEQSPEVQADSHETEQEQQCQADGDDHRTPLVPASGSRAHQNFGAT